MLEPITKIMFNSVKEFMETFDQKLYPHPEAVPCNVCTLRSELIKEEAREYYAAPVRSLDELDAIVDLLYVVIGTNVAFNSPVDPYNSGQVTIPNLPKQTISETQLPLTQNLDCLFPCPKILYKTTNDMIKRLLDIGAQHGYKIKEAFQAVHHANMGKLWNPDSGPFPKDCFITTKNKGILVKNAFGKVIKPPDFKAPDLSAYL